MGRGGGMVCGSGRHGVIVVVCGMWSTWRVVDVAWLTCVVVNPSTRGEGQGGSWNLRLRVVVGARKSHGIVTQVTRVMLSHTSLN